MTHEELAKLNFENAQLQMSITSTAFSITTLEYLSIVLAGQRNLSIETINAEVSQRLQQNIANVEYDLRNKVPQSELFNYRKN